MQADIQDLGGLRRRVDLTVASGDIAAEVSQRLSKMARQASLPGFRRGKVPLKMVAASYGAQVQADVTQEKLGSALRAALDSQKLRLAGAPRLEPRPAAADGDLSFSATFEIYPDIDPGDLSQIRVQRLHCDVSDKDVDATIEVIRRQRASYAPTERAAADGDRVTVDFQGSINGQVFNGGEAKDVAFVLGQGRMLPQFEQAVRAMRAGEQKQFALTFPADYPAKEVAGVQAQFSVQVTRVEQGTLPAVDSAFAQSLGVADGGLERMRLELRSNLQREVLTRLRSRTAETVLGALEQAVRFDVPESLVEDEMQRIRAAAESIKPGPAPEDSESRPTALRRVRLGLLVGELTARNRLQPRQEQIRAAVESIAQSYQKPSEVIQWYLTSRERLAPIEADLTQDNLVAWVLQHAQVTDVTLTFDELMERRAAK
jgi:trigger factor